MEAPLTTQQKSRFRRAYRDTFGADNHGEAVKALYLKYSDLYGVPADVLRAIVASELETKPQEYAKLRQGLAARQASTKPQSPAKKQPVKDLVSPLRETPPVQKRAKSKANLKARKSRKGGQLAVCNRRHAPWDYCSACEGHDRNVKESNHSVRFEDKRGTTRVVGGGLPGLGKGR